MDVVVVTFLEAYLLGLFRGESLLGTFQAHPLSLRLNWSLSFDLLPLIPILGILSITLHHHTSTATTSSLPVFTALSWQSAPSGPRMQPAQWVQHSLFILSFHLLRIALVSF